jgi:hypothetical protein
MLLAYRPRTHVGQRPCHTYCKAYLNTIHEKRLKEGNRLFYSIRYYGR